MAVGFCSINENNNRGGISRGNNKMKNCDFCGNQLEDSFIAKDRMGFTKKNFIWKKCSKCGLLQLSGAKDNQYFQEYYFKEKDSIVDKIIFLNRLNIFKYFINKKSNILEIGCGSGRFLNFLYKNGFRNLWGVEYSKKALEYMKQFKFNTSKKIPLKLFDLIIMEASLEHVESPKKMFKEISKVLSSNGVLIVTIPNIESLQSKNTGKYWFHLDTPRHLFMFKKENLEKYCSLFNLKVTGEHHFNFQYELPGWIYSKKRDPNYSFVHNLVSLIYLPIFIYVALTKQSSVVSYVIKRQ